MAAFVFARFAFRGRELLFTLFTVGLMFPFAVAILPLFILLRSFDLLDNPLGRDPAAGGLRAAGDDHHPARLLPHHPRRVEEAATLDGCTAVRLLLAHPAADGPARAGHRLGARDRRQLEQLHAAAGRVQRPDLVDAAASASSSSRASTPPTPPASWPTSCSPWCPRSRSTPSPNASSSAASRRRDQGLTTRTALAPPCTALEEFHGPPLAGHHPARTTSVRRTCSPG